MRKLLLILFVLQKILIAQTYTIKGKVTDDHGTPLSGVNVVIKGTGTGTASDTEGKFSLPVEGTGTYNLSFSMIGYRKIESSVAVSENVDLGTIRLQETVIESDQVVVTAGKYEQRLQDLPVSASVMRAETITQKNFISLDQALRYAPGVSVNLDQVSIRGSSGYSRGAGTRVLVAYDGIPIYTGDTGEIIWELIPVTEIDRVEIIKGASSSLYGSTAIGGVINVISREMQSQPQTYIKTYYGVYDKPAHDEWDWSGEYRQFNGLSLSHSNSIGGLKFTISGTRLQSDGYRENDYYKRYIGYLKTHYAFSPVSSLSFFINSLNMDRGNFVYWKDSRHALQPPDADLGQSVVSARIFSGLIFKTALSSRFLFQSRTSYYNTHWKDETSSENSSTVNLLREEVQATVTAFDDMLIIGGIEGTYGKVRSDLFRNPVSKTIGTYLQADYHFSFPLFLSAGVRFDYSKLDTLESTGSVSPKVGLNYHFSDNLVARASAGKGFRAPTLAEAFTRTAASGITIVPNPDIKPESNYTVEAGINYSLGDVLVTDAAIFHNEYYDMIEAGVVPQTGQVSFRNVTHAKIQGTELNVTYRLFDPLHFRVNYIYLWARDVDLNKSLKYRPRHMAAAGMDFHTGSLRASLDFRFWSRIDELDTELVELGLVTDGDLRVPVYVTDLSAGYNLAGFGIPLNITLNAKNLLNYNYIEIIGNLSPIRNVSLGLELVF